VHLYKESQAVHDLGGHTPIPNRTRRLAAPLVKRLFQMNALSEGLDGLLFNDHPRKCVK